MKILVLTMSFFNIGGIENYVRNLTRALGNLYGKRSIDVLSAVGKLPSNVDDEYYKTIITAGNILNFFTKIKFIWKCFLLTWRNNYNLIVCCHVFLSPVAFLTKKFFGIRYITIAYGIDVDRKLSLFQRIGLKNSCRVVAISKFTQEILHTKHGIEQLKVSLLNPCISQEAINNSNQEERLKILRTKHNLKDNRVVLTVARLVSTEKYKGYDTVISALPKVIEKVPNVKYLLIGEGDDIPRIKKLSEDIGIRDHVIFIGFVSDEDLQYYYNLCDVFVMPSKREGFGIVFLEALACGKSVVAGNKDGSRDALLDGKLGILVDPDNVEQIANSMIDVLEKRVAPYLLDEKYLKNIVAEHFGFETFSKKVKEIFAEYEL